jgi:hypothetical protein
MKFLYISLFLWVIFALLDPDLDFESGSGSTDLMESGYKLDPKHCLYVLSEGRKGGAT